MERRPTALIFLADLEAGGAQRTMLNLARGLEDTGLSTSVAVGRSNGPIVPWAEGLRLIDLRAPRLRMAAYRLRRQLLMHPVDVVLSTMLHANIAAAIAVASLRRQPLLLLRE